MRINLIPNRIPDDVSSPTNLLSVGPIRQIRLDLTSRCNLRCVYCAVSQKAYVGADMQPPDVERAVRTILDLARFHPLDPVDINGHGETTIVAGWTDTCKALLEAGLKLRLTTNFAKEFTADELGVLARMQGIAISIDTSDRMLLKRLRRKVDLRQIITNIAFVRSVARRNYSIGPSFGFITGLYDQNSLLVEDLARLAVTLGINTVSFWSLTKYPYSETDVRTEDQALPLDDLSDDELLPRIISIRRGIRILKRAGVSVYTHADFINTLAKNRGFADG
jgi:MoaA/NifB/PqqE/SkfB family radical SAM enzyme